MTGSTKQSTQESRRELAAQKDKKFKTSAIKAEEEAHSDGGSHSKRRSLFQVTDTKLFTNAQKFHFSHNGKLLAIGDRYGCRISVLKVHTDEFGSLLDMSLVAICYRGFRACNLKEISFSENLDYMIVTSDAGTVHLFDVKAAHEDRPINIVRS